MNAVRAKRSLKAIEQNITKNANNMRKSGLEIGRDLLEIRDEELWKYQHDSWEQYLTFCAKDLVGVGNSQCKALIQAAEVSRRLPASCPADISASALNELGRLAVKNNYSDIKKGDVRRVLNAAKKLSDNGSMTVKAVRQAVDNDLGIDRAEMARESRREAAAARQIDLHDYLRRIEGTSAGWLDVLQNVPADGWDELTVTHPGLLDGVVQQLEALLDFLKE